MNLWPGPDAPFILKAGAASLLVLHIGGGTVGIVAGWTALLARKGRRLHNVAGNAFFAGMLAMTGVGVTVSPVLPAEQFANTTAAAFTLYLITTSWAAVRRRPGEVGRFERAALVVPAGVITLALVLAIARPVLRTEPFLGAIYAFAIFSAFAVAGDLNMIRQGGLRGPSRIARHLWRMGLALFIACGSFFLGQDKFLPAPIRHSFLPLVPVLGSAGFTLFWLAKTLWPRRRRRASVAAAA